MPDDDGPPVPSTLKRSTGRVHRTYEKTLEHAENEYGDEQRAHRTAWSSVKNIAEKRGSRTLASSRWN